MPTATTTFERVLAVPLVLAALVVAFLLVRREFTDVDTPTTALRLTPLDASDWSDLSSGPTAFGLPGAAVTIAEFGDFECPACRSFATTTLARIRADYPTQVRLVYRHRPLAQHRFAVQAASASECARSAGRFEVMHDLLYATQDSLGLLPWGTLGLRAGLQDSAGFESCVRRADHLSIQQDTVLAERLEVHEVPSLAINGHRLSGVPSQRQLTRIVDSILSAR